MLAGRRDLLHIRPHKFYLIRVSFSFSGIVSSNFSVIVACLQMTPVLLTLTYEM